MRTAGKRQDSPDHVGQNYHCQQVGQPVEESLKLEMMEEGNGGRLADVEGKTAKWTKQDKRQPTATVYTQISEFQEPSVRGKHSLGNAAKKNRENERSACSYRAMISARWQRYGWWDRALLQQNYPDDTQLDVADIPENSPVPGQAGEMGQQEPFSAEGNAEGLTQERRKTYKPGQDGGQLAGKQVCKEDYRAWWTPSWTRPSNVSLQQSRSTASWAI